MSRTILIAGIVVVVLVFYLGIRILRVYLKLRGQRVVQCPETEQPAAVELAAGSLALKAVAGPPELNLQSCSRWPERGNCGQECLRQIEASPEGCLVRSILTKWYQEKSCIYCGKRLGEIDWIGHKPCLLNASWTTIEWKDVPAERLASVLETHKPVCWNCHIAHTFRREHSDLVTDRDWKKN